MTATSRPASPTQDLWSSILDSVSRTRSTPSKQILILGEPRTGKSALASALLQKPLDLDRPRDDFALGFDWADVRDDADEDTLARLSVYTVQSSNPVHTALIPHVLPPKSSLGNTLAMIVLDWTKPWTFVEQLEFWISWIETWAQGDGNRELEVAREEGKERLLYHIQHYTEPTDEPLPITTSTMTSSALPLPQGSFTNNTAGVPIIVVCTKADLIDDNSDIAGGTSGMGGMVKSKGGEWEERTDGIMQVLRTICLKYGAALFYSTQVPATVSALRKYSLHFLFAPPPPQPSIGSTDAPAPVRNLFKFTDPVNALDRDRIVIPAGWDSWGKIKILRDEFEPSRWNDAWDRDMEAFSLPKIAATAWSDSTTMELPLAPPLPNGARSNFASLVGSDRGITKQSLPAIIRPTPEQAFLQQHYEALAKDPARDPRATFRQPAVAVDGAAISSSAGGAGGVGVGVVGPMGGNTFGLPTVERALVEMEGGGDKERSDRPQDRDRDRLGGRQPATGASAPRREGRAATMLQPLNNSSSASRGAASPTALGSGLGLGQSQQDVLNRFFESLLHSRTGAGGSTTTPQAGAPTNSQPTNASTENQNDPQS
ncbi:hypothetical protein FRB91_004314 [Serendipita sp. 411]|nr:hypothetical protein FRC15_005406 [Serendipita sp. 397]KAG8827059.1 hypothetical protein FRC19_005763 [Serendipita sp. 401]KAG8838648.1 hypothetical protein FRC18_003473 [Serendipita sp. 400]KAG8860230.1 hypothetical protein FRB91_004314 [Serendipita sp. 411]KAG9057531.1 hypothetical protein FS842_006061 [Serendipita sp. 407]